MHREKEAPNLQRAGITVCPSVLGVITKSISTSKLINMSRKTPDGKIVITLEPLEALHLHTITQFPAVQRLIKDGKFHVLARTVKNLEKQVLDGVTPEDMDAAFEYIKQLLRNNL
jgi:hypothetical protein